MSTVLAVLFFVLKCIGVLLLVLLALLVVLLLTPVGIRADWRPAGYTVYALLGPLHVLLAPRPTKAKKKKPAKKEAEKKPVENAAPSQDEKPEKDPEKDPKKDKDKSEDGFAATVRGQLEETVEQLKRDPLETIRHLLDIAAPLGGRLLRGLHIRHLVIYWTVTRDEADATALAYGQEIALSNILLARAQELMDLRADELRLEADFTGKLAQNRHLACQITVRPYIMAIIGVKLLWQIYHAQNGTK